jgi:hypothetical protein
MAASALLHSQVTAKTATTEYADFVNPQWARLLAVLGMDTEYVRGSGAFWKDALEIARRAVNL